MAIRPSLLHNAAAAAVPYEIPLAPGQDIRLSSVTAVWNGAGASGSFLACLSIYSQDGVLLSRTFPSQVLATGDSGEVTYAPFLGDAAGATPASTSQEWAMPILIRAAELSATSNNIECNTGPTWVHDANYTDATYLKLGDANGDHISFLVDFGPYGGRFKVQPLCAFGPNHGKITVSLGTVPPSVDVPETGELANVGEVTFVNIPTQTMDYYRAGFDAIRAVTTPVFRITGEAGDIGSAFTLNGDHYDWNGGPGPMRVKLTVNGKNASSGGFELRFSGLLISRVDDFNQP